jgi:replication factor C subunit 1
MAVKSAFHIGGESGGMLSSFPEFSTWLGRNSSKSKRDRLLQELGHHMNYKISADKSELRLGYLPVIRDKFVDLLMNKDGPKVEEAIEFMDEYGLDRDDVFENIDEFTMEKNPSKMADLDSKAKAAFTREYNKGVHMSQALVEEQGLQTKKRKKSTIDEDQNDQSDDGEEMTEAEIQKIFKKSSKGKKKKIAAKAKKTKK